MKQGEQKDNLSGFEAIDIAWNDESIQLRKADQKWITLSELVKESGELFNIMWLHEKDWSIRKLQSNLEKAVKEIKSIMYEPSSRSLIDVKTILYKYITN